MAEHKMAATKSATKVLLTSRLYTIRVIQPIVPKNKRNVRFPHIILMNKISFSKKAWPKKMVFNEKKIKEVVAPMLGELRRIWFMYMIRIIVSENVVKRNFSSRAISSTISSSLHLCFISYRPLLLHDSCPYLLPLSVIPIRKELLTLTYTFSLRWKRSLIVGLLK